MFTRQPPVKAAARQGSGALPEGKGWSLEGAAKRRPVRVCLASGTGAAQRARGRIPAEAAPPRGDTRAHARRFTDTRGRISEAGGKRSCMYSLLIGSYWTTRLRSDRVLGVLVQHRGEAVALSSPLAVHQCRPPWSGEDEAGRALQALLEADVEPDGRVESIAGTGGIRQSARCAMAPMKRRQCGAPNFATFSSTKARGVPAGMPLRLVDCAGAARPDLPAEALPPPLPRCNAGAVRPSRA